jgi:hypothetical protein
MLLLFRGKDIFNSQRIERQQPWAVGRILCITYGFQCGTLGIRELELVGMLEQQANDRQIDARHFRGLAPALRRLGSTAHSTLPRCRH